MCSVTGGGITYWGETNGKDPQNFLMVEKVRFASKKCSRFLSALLAIRFQVKFKCNWSKLKAKHGSILLKAENIGQSFSRSLVLDKHKIL